MKIWPKAWGEWRRETSARISRAWPGWLKSGGDTLLLGLAMLAAALTVWMVLVVNAGVSRAPAAAAVAPDSLAAAAATAGQEDLLQYCLTTVAGRQVFQRPQVKSRVGRESTSPARAVASVLAADYQLAGIIGGDPPKALLRNRRTNTLHYAAVGELVGELKVTEIRERSVLLEANGEEIEISL